MALALLSLNTPVFRSIASLCSITCLDHFAAPGAARVRVALGLGFFALAFAFIVDDSYDGYWVRKVGLMMRNLLDRIISLKFTPHL